MIISKSIERLSKTISLSAIKKGHCFSGPFLLFFRQWLLLISNQCEQRQRKQQALDDPATDSIVDATTGASIAGSPMPPANAVVAAAANTVAKTSFSCSSPNQCLTSLNSAS